MFGPRIELFRIAGIPLRIDLSWILIFVLISWSLAVSLFPLMMPERTTAVYWGMGVVGALGLFASIVVHEMAHALTGRRFDLHVRSITLFIFGGVAELTDEPPSPRAEFWVAIAGPIASVAIFALAWLLAAFGAASAWPAPAIAVLSYLAWINLVVVVFNLIPAFPLDGGRVLRSALWQWKKNLRWATRITSQIGSGFGVALIVLGVIGILFGAFVAGLWWVLIGMFLRSAAQMGYQQLMIRRALEGEPVRRFMRTEVHAAPPDITVAQLVDDYIYRYHHKLFPIVQDGRLLGCVTTREVRNLPRERWPEVTVAELVRSCGAPSTISPEADAMQALSRMNSEGLSRLVVVDDAGALRGVLSLKDLVRFLGLKIELEEGGGPISVASAEREASTPVARPVHSQP